MRTHISLTEQIFLSLLGVAFLSLIIMGSFWTFSKISDYRKEVKSIKNSYSELHKSEIRSEILKVKDFIEWIKHNPAGPSVSILNKNIDHLNEKLNRLDYSDNNEKEINNLIHDSLFCHLLPAYIFNANHELLYKYLPEDRKSGYKMNELEINIIQALLQSENDRDTCVRHNNPEPSDYTGQLYACSVKNNNTGLKIISGVAEKDILKALQAYALDSISRIRFSENEYVFVNTIDSLALVTHGILNHKPVEIMKSGNQRWQNVYRKQQESALNQDGVFHRYLWPKLSSPDTCYKTSYFSYTPGWKWIIGAGFYEDDVEIIVAQRRSALIDSLMRSLFIVLLFLLISAFLSFLIARHISNQFRKNLEVFHAFFSKPTIDNFRIDLSKIRFKEIHYLADSANRMADRQVEDEKRLYDSKAKMEAALGNMGDAVFISDTEGRFIDFNEAFARFLKFSNKSECPYNFNEYPEFLEIYYADGTLRPRDQWAIPRALRGKTGYNEEFYLKRKDTGESFIGSYNYSPIRDANGKIIGAVVTAHDITEQKKSEAEIKKLNEKLEERVRLRTAQLEAANKELESFSYSVSHDLRAPLRAISGFSQILAGRHRESLNDEGRQYMDYVVEAGHRMEILINDLLEYSRIGRKAVNLQQVPLIDLIDSVHLVFRQELEKVGAEFVTNKHLPVIISDKTILHQAFTNLISNAIKYRKKDVPLKIAIGYEKPAGYHILSVSDNGIGIHESYWIKIFDVFQRLHSEEGYPGTGIGLASVKKGIALLDGTVWVDSALDKGSTFYIKLPEYKI
jgi:signal transduction histidine kinase